MKKQTVPEAVLGIAVMQNRIEAALLRPVGEKIEIVHRLGRKRERSHEKVGPGSLATAVPGLKSSNDSDFTLEVGDGSNGASSENLYLETEPALPNKMPDGEPGRTVAAARPAPFVPQLKEILGECLRLGYKSPKLAFCIGIPDVSYEEVAVPSSDRNVTAPGFLTGGRQKQFARTGSGINAALRRRLLQQLATQHPGRLEENRVAFIPMRSKAGQARYLAVIPESSDPVQPTVTALSSQRAGKVPPVELVESEASLLIAMAREAFKPSAREHTAIVHVGVEDTQLFFLAGGELLYFERLRSLTSFDSAETVCSRILLQQDEQKIRELNQILLVGGQTDQLRESFHRHYPRAAVTPLPELLPALGAGHSGSGEAARPGSDTAVGMGLRLAGSWSAGNDASAVSLPLPAFSRNRRITGFLTWHSLAMLVVLGCLMLFFALRYVAQQEEVLQLRAQLETAAPDHPITMEAALLQARIDSLSRAHQTYTRALHVIDSLIVGSNMWSSMMERLAQSTGALSNVWLKAWHMNGTDMRIEGFATTRQQVVQLARRLDGSIERLTFNEIGDVRVFSFIMLVTVPAEIPAFVHYLQEAAFEED